MRHALTLSACALGLTALLALAPAQALPLGTGPLVKVRDDVRVHIETRSQPHASCDFWVEGYSLTATAGVLAFTSVAPTGNGSAVLNATWAVDNSSANLDGHFLAGPFHLAPGHYQVDILAALGVVLQTKQFWIDPCNLPPQLPCPTSFTVEARGNASVALAFDAAATLVGHANGTVNAGALLVYRATGTGDFHLLATLAANATTFVDTDTTAGTTYTYLTTALYGVLESTKCKPVVVTTVPEFPTPYAGALAAVAGLGAYVAIRRRS